MNEMMILGLIETIGAEIGINPLSLIGDVIATTSPKATKKVYVLTETDTDDPTWVHVDTFPTLADAQDEMRRRYHEDVVERYELFEEAHIDAMMAYAQSKAVGEVIAWNIKECEVAE